jgi:hypothetical protein
LPASPADRREPTPRQPHDRIMAARTVSNPWPWLQGPVSRHDTGIGVVLAAGSQTGGRGALGERSVE